MKMYFNQSYDMSEIIDIDLTKLDLQESIQKTRQALDDAYAGFDNALDVDLIDSYIYEMNALQKKYKHLLALAEAEAQKEPEILRQHSPIRALVSHVFG